MMNARTSLGASVKYSGNGSCNEHISVIAHKNVVKGRKPFIRRIQKTCENDLHEPQVNDYGYNEGIIC